MRISDLATCPFREDKVTTAGHWSVHDYFDTEGFATRTLYHYATAMLTWSVNDPTVYWIESIGHGSVSDQGGMNRVFKALGIKRYYSRHGGATIE